MSATRPEWPNVVGSRCSMARTAACTNPSNRRSISRYSWLGIRLGEAGPQALLARLALDEVEATRVGRRDAARLGEDQVQQAIEVALGAERDADPRELTDLAAAARCLGPRPRRFRAGGGLAISRPYGHEQLSRTCGGAHEARQQLGRYRGRGVRLAVAPQRHHRTPPAPQSAQRVQRE